MSPMERSFLGPCDRFTSLCPSLATLVSLTSEQCDDCPNHATAQSSEQRRWPVRTCTTHTGHRSGPGMPIAGSAQRFATHLPGPASDGPYRQARLRLAVQHFGAMDSRLRRQLPDCLAACADRSPREPLVHLVCKSSTSDYSLGTGLSRLVDHRSAGQAAFEVVRGYPSGTAADSSVGHAARSQTKAPRWIVWRWYLVTHIVLA
jgi:hypothetical protein